MLCYDSFFLMGEVALCAFEMIGKMVSDHVLLRGMYSGPKGLFRLNAILSDKQDNKSIEQVILYSLMYYFYSECIIDRPRN